MAGDPLVQQIARHFFAFRDGYPAARPRRTPHGSRAPNANAYAERFVRSIKEEWLDRLIPVGERHFPHAVTEFVENYHRERNHQGLANELIATTDPTRRVRRRPRLGGLLNYYERTA